MLSVSCVTQCKCKGKESESGQYSRATGSAGADLIHRDMQRLMPPAVSFGGVNEGF